MSETDLDSISGEIVHAAYGIHVGVGPGLLESVYESLLKGRLETRGLKVERQKYVAFECEGQQFTEGLRLDLLVENTVIVEVKSVDVLLPVHAKQLLTYLRLLDLRLGLLINFGGATIKEGLRRVVNDFNRRTPTSPVPPRFRLNSADVPQANDS